MEGDFRCTSGISAGSDVIGSGSDVFGAAEVAPVLSVGVEGADAFACGGKAQVDGDN